ncbi:hypothetical protein IU501_25045 [Nocardia otitidiscaviarum]|uniref:hypothetical protein n=1 Tax=Nocardia otitidiscaviarum TaxID=1823 RepID=UPI0004A76784|nr:hypothetical protein [Nocardia otitidiscaviarum]MBF6136256.1 hypothetical protein [Nocardia otitidiscaviarum]MBF6484458.1 hypothetical protein [Nocardia otitidiscaviarum]
MTVTEINGLPLPKTLVGAIAEGRWKAPDTRLLKQVFGEEPQQPNFYSLEYMRTENRHWIDVAAQAPTLCGHPDESTPPGDIDPALSVLIGDLGYDQPFALDFRTSRVEPRVIYASLQSGRWITVAPQIEHLLRQLGL